MEKFIKNLEKKDKAIDEFDVEIWRIAIDRVTIQMDSNLAFHFKDESMISIYV